MSSTAAGRHLTVLAVIFSLTCASVGRADPRGNIRVTEDPVTLTLVDRAVVEGRTALQVRALPAYSQRIVPVLSLAAQFPAMGRAFATILEKEWYLDSGGITDCPFHPNASGKVGILSGCQDGLRVILDGKTFRSAFLSRGPEAEGIQADTIIHELVRGLSFGRDVSEDDVFHLVTLLSRQPLPNAEELKLALKRWGFADLATPGNAVTPAATAEQIDAVKALLTKISASCALYYKSPWSKPSESPYYSAPCVDNLATAAATATRLSLGAPGEAARRVIVKLMNDCGKKGVAATVVDPGSLAYGKDCINFAVGTAQDLLEDQLAGLKASEALRAAAHGTEPSKASEVRAAAGVAKEVRSEAAPAMVSGPFTSAQKAE